MKFRELNFVKFHFDKKKKKNACDVSATRFFNCGFFKQEKKFRNSKNVTKKARNL